MLSAVGKEDTLLLVLHRFSLTSDARDNLRDGGSEPRELEVSSFGFGFESFGRFKEAHERAIFISLSNMAR
jgi:hypothetical protein